MSVTSSLGSPYGLKNAQKKLVIFQDFQVQCDFKIQGISWTFRICNNPTLKICHVLKQKLHWLHVCQRSELKLA